MKKGWREEIVSAEPTIGYIHRAFEKLAERRPYNQITPITDRLNYCSSPINNMGWHMNHREVDPVRIAKTCAVYACDYHGIIAHR